MQSYVLLCGENKCKKKIIRNRYVTLYGVNKCEIIPWGDKRLIFKVRQILLVTGFPDFVVAVVSVAYSPLFTPLQHPLFAMDKENPHGGMMILSPNRGLHRRRKSLGLGSPLSTNKENPKDLSSKRRSNRRKSLDGLSPQSPRLSPRINPNGVGFRSPLSTSKENPKDLSSKRRSNRRKSLDGLSPRSPGLSPRITPNVNNTLQVNVVHLYIHLAYPKQGISTTILIQLHGSSSYSFDGRVAELRASKKRNSFTG